MDWSIYIAPMCVYSHLTPTVPRIIPALGRIHPHPEQSVYWMNEWMSEWVNESLHESVTQSRLVIPSESFLGVDSQLYSTARVWAAPAVVYRPSWAHFTVNDTYMAERPSTGASGVQLSHGADDGPNRSRLSVNDEQSCRQLQDEETPTKKTG